MIARNPGPEPVCNHMAGTEKPVRQRLMRENGDKITVHLPAELPSLTTSVSRTLLAILVELTEVENAFDDRRHRGMR